MLGSKVVEVYPHDPMTHKAQCGWSPYDRWNLLRRKRSTSASNPPETRFMLRDYPDPVAIIETIGAASERYNYDSFGPLRFVITSFVTQTTSECARDFAQHGGFKGAESDVNTFYQF
ncbi:hypothetical protein JIN85_17870 [Luteolibacter pohnpeiensis]|uniref:Uncharacterized protein n=1 Tax=Luteolibacter pohnpeiensis TaxID=454153 RepID=A0A934SDU0_9BACT|nr:hypothetical protein [Luteolibacter pohnpeiensis]MBK1884292.1 hypothetical protein [Luteolibacter pohnpeiensis]